MAWGMFHIWCLISDVCGELKFCKTKLNKVQWVDTGLWYYLAGMLCIRCCGAQLFLMSQSKSALTQKKYRGGGVFMMKDQKSQKMLCWIRPKDIQYLRVHKQMKSLLPTPWQRVVNLKPMFCHKVLSNLYRTDLWKCNEIDIKHTLSGSLTQHPFINQSVYLSVRATARDISVIIEFY